MVSDAITSIFGAYGRVLPPDVTDLSLGLLREIPLLNRLWADAVSQPIDLRSISSYPGTQGSIRFRTAVARLFFTERGIEIDPDMVVATHGAYDGIASIPCDDCGGHARSISHAGFRSCSRRLEGRAYASSGQLARGCTDLRFTHGAHRRDRQVAWVIRRGSRIPLQSRRKRLQRKRMALVARCCCRERRTPGSRRRVRLLVRDPPQFPLHQRHNSDRGLDVETVGGAGAAGWVDPIWFAVDGAASELQLRPRVSVFRESRSSLLPLGSSYSSNAVAVGREGGAGAKAVRASSRD